MSPKLATSTRPEADIPEDFRALGRGADDYLQAILSTSAASATSLFDRLLRTQVGVKTAATEPLRPQISLSDPSSTEQPLEDSEHRESQELEASLRRLAWDARDEAFEDGVESDFARELSRFLAVHGSRGLEVLVGLSMREQMEPGVLAEALFAVARSKDANTHRHRFWLLVASLFHPSAQVRDAAGLGLVTMGERRGVIYLRKAIQAEPIQELKYELERAQSQLEV